MNTGLFDYEVLLAATILLASVVLIAQILLVAYLLKDWVKKNVGTRRPETIKPGEGFFFYEHGQLRYDVCDQNHADIGVIYTLLNRRVEYKNVSKL
jgi:hypothetical protein